MPTYAIGIYHLRDCSVCAFAKNRSSLGVWHSAVVASFRGKESCLATPRLTTSPSRTSMGEKGRGGGMTDPLTIALIATIISGVASAIWIINHFRNKPPDR